MKSKLLRFLWKLTKEIGNLSVCVVYVTGGGLLGGAGAFVLLYTMGTIVHLLGFGSPHENILDLGASALGPIVLIFFVGALLRLIIQIVYEWVKELWESS